jgi:hypothetical protein
MRRWLVFLAALAGSALLAAGLAVAVDRATAASGQAPQLRTVPASSLAASGITLGAATVPPYCGLEQAAAQGGWMPSGAGGCPIGRSAAEAIVTRGGSARVLESLLARASAAGRTSIGQDHLVWLVVVRSSAVMLPMIACVRGPAIVTPCPPPVAVAGNTLAMLDASSGRMVQLLTVGPSGTVSPWRPTPGVVPGPMPPIASRPASPIARPAAPPAATPG